MVLDLTVVGLLGVLVWRLDQLVKIAKQVHIELVTARWEGNQRIRRLERQVEGDGEDSLPVGGKSANRL